MIEVFPDCPRCGDAPVIGVVWLYEDGSDYQMTEGCTNGCHLSKEELAMVKEASIKEAEESYSLGIWHII